MAITYNIAECKGGYGIYIRALSGSALESLLYRLPEIEEIDGQLMFGGKPLRGAVAVLSDRITRKKTLPQAKKALNRIKSLPPDQQTEIARKRFLKPIEKDFKLAKLQYTQLHWKYGNSYIKPFTTQDRDYAERIAMQYAEGGTPAKLVKTVGKNRKLTYEGYDKAIKRGELKPEIAKGLKGMCKPLKDQAPEMLRRIGQRRKRTTTNEFYQRYR